MSDVVRYLDGVRARCEAATDGPVDVLREDLESGAIRWELWIGEPADHDGLTPPILMSTSDDCPATAKNDVELFRHARTDLPRLEAAVRKVWERRYTPQDTGDLDYRTADGYQRGYEQAMHEAREIIREALEVE